MTVDASRLLVRLSGRFSAAEASAGDGLVLRIALLSLLPLETRLEGIEVCMSGANVCVCFFFFRIFLCFVFPRSGSVFARRTLFHAFAFCARPACFASASCRVFPRRG